MLKQIRNKKGRPPTLASIPSPGAIRPCSYRRYAASIESHARVDRHSRMRQINAG